MGLQKVHKKAGLKAQEEYATIQKNHGEEKLEDYSTSVA